MNAGISFKCDYIIILKNFFKYRDLGDNVSVILWWLAALSTPFINPSIF